MAQEYIVATAKELDWVITDPLDGRMMATIIATDTLADLDNFCSPNASIGGVFEYADLHLN